MTTMTGVGTRSFGRVTSAAILVCAGALLACPPVVAAMYKWVDDQGVVHYSDKVPLEAIGKGATVLDKQGRAVKKIEPAPTPEQVKAMEAQEEQKRAEAMARQERARKDRALMLSYTTEAEIDIAKKRALSTIDAQIKVAQAYSAELARKKQVLLRKEASYGGKPVPMELERELSTVETELARQTGLIEQKNADIAAVTAKYDADKRRWQEIKADENRAADAAVVPADEPAAGKGAPAKGPAGTRTSTRK
jgi:Domain of unknown function (DUF4124)